MGRGPKPAKGKAKPAVARKSPKNGAARVRDLEERLAEALRDKSEALEQQTATSEILRVISSSPTDLLPALNAVAASAARVCQAYDASIFRVEEGGVRLVAHQGPIASLPIGFVLRLVRETVVGRSVLDRRIIHLHDAQQEQKEFPEAIAVARRLGSRTTLAAPLLREGVAVGAILIRRTEVAPFSPKQIALLQTFADQAVIAIENVRLFKELQASNRELTTALDKQTATSDILRVISQSQTNVQPVFDAIVTNAVRLLRGNMSTLTRLVGDQIELAAFTGSNDVGDAAHRARFPLPLHSEEDHGQVMRSRAPLNSADAHSDPRLPARQHESARLRGYRSFVVVPLLRHDEAIGTLGVAHGEPGGFTDDEIAVLQTFADQAVIAIENVRLFKELEARNRDLTATSEILQVISRSPTDAQPVFDTIARNATRLCDGRFGAVFQVRDGLIHLVAKENWNEKGLAGAGLVYPVPVDGPGVVAEVIREGTVCHIPDLERDPRMLPQFLRIPRALGVRSHLIVPMLRGASAVGAVIVARTEAGPFAESQVDLLKTFADQAVIAIENVRLFTELEEKNRALTEAHAQVTDALEQQTATAEILRVISRSQTDVQPVFDAIVQSAVRLLRAHSGMLTRVAGDWLELAAFTSIDRAYDDAIRAYWPRPLHSKGGHTQAIRERAPINIADAGVDPRVPEAGRAVARLSGLRSVASVPLLRNDEAIGTVVVNRQEPGGFTDDEIALLQTFADQAVIAIENVRLLTELQARTEDLSRSIGELRALSEVGQAIGSTLDLQTVLSTIVARATQLADADAGVIYEYDAEREVFEPRATERLEAEIVQALVATPVRKGQGATGRLAEVAEPVQLADVRSVTAQIPVRGALIDAGYRALLAVPLMREEHLIGGLTVFRKTVGEFAPNVVELMQTFATQSALAIQNARLFREIEIKSRQLEVASQHKSEFLANMSHELRTPLNAIIGFSEVLTDRMFGELNEKQDEYLKDIYASGTHLLSLINDILDLSKIEAGRMELELTDFHLPTALDNALTLVRERAGRGSITLQTSIDQQLGEIHADERKIRQVVLNLLSNAIKFTPEGGRIEVAAVSKDGAVEVSVSDTGVGIAPEDQEAVFEEFRQVGTAEKKSEGTGLGLTLCRKFIELHGGRIWVKSQVGQGSTFTFTIPVRQGE